jgi:hypothetical protein
MDLGVIIAVSAIGITMVGVMISMMFWMRGEANSLRIEAKSDRKDLVQISRNLEITVNAIEAEIKDFHRRLCTIEERNKL